MQNMIDRNMIVKKIGIFGGAFNPVHNGHIALAQYYFTLLGLDVIFFVPTANPPHRSGEDFIPGKDRIKMLKLAIDNKRGFEVSDCEFSMQGKSYSYNTILYFKEKLPDAEIFLIIGADQFLKFDKWYRADDILQMVTVCTAARKGNIEHKNLIKACAEMPIFSNRKTIIADYRPINISSNQIRDMIKSGSDVSNYIDKNVLTYINEKGLYL